MPGFIAIGPPRTASTWLDKVLRGRVGLPAHKESDYFKRNYWRGEDWYRGQFRDCPPGLPLMEVCPTYFPLAECRERIARDLPAVKIIVTLRDPVARAYSYYRMLRRMGWEKQSFEQAVARRKDLADCNRYATHLKAWIEAFGERNVLVCFYDDLKLSRQAYIDRICDFIGIAHFAVGDLPFAEERINGVAREPRNYRLAREARKVKIWLHDNNWIRTDELLERAGVWDYCWGRGAEFPPVDRALEARMREQYRPEIEELERIVGRDLSAWKTGA